MQRSTDKKKRAKMEEYARKNLKQDREWFYL